MIINTGYKNLEILAYSLGCPERPDGLNEDAFRVGKKGIGVADGNTQLSYAQEELATKRSIALELAELWCAVVAGFMDDSLSKNAERRTIVMDAMRLANEEVGRFNKEHKIVPDFWTTDYASCYGAGAFVDNEKFYYGFISDCFVAVLDSRDKWKLEAMDDMIPVHDFWASIQGRETREYVTRALIRNKPELRDKRSRRLAYGTFTGERGALEFLHVGEVALEPGDILLLGTDGILPYLGEREFIETLRASDAGIESYLENGNTRGCPWWKERTLVVGRMAEA